MAGTLLKIFTLLVIAGLFVLGTLLFGLMFIVEACVLTWLPYLLVRGRKVNLVVKLLIVLLPIMLWTGLRTYGSILQSRNQVMLQDRMEIDLDRYRKELYGY